jgi:hypothetical protein
MKEPTNLGSRTRKKRAEGTKIRKSGLIKSTHTRELEVPNQSKSRNIRNKSNQRKKREELRYSGNRLGSSLRKSSHKCKEILNKISENCSKA